MDYQENLETWRGQIFGDGELYAEIYETGTAIECQRKIEHHWEQIFPPHDSPFQDCRLEMRRISYQPIGPQVLRFRPWGPEAPATGLKSSQGDTAREPRSIPWEERYR